MIKLITCDIDGTLLRDYSGSLSTSLTEVIRKFQQNGVMFVAASGRQLPNLKKIFNEIGVDSEINFIGENGGIISYENEIIHKSIMDKSKSLALSNKALAADGLELLICGEKTTYIIPKCPEFLNLIKNEVKNDITVINSLDELKEDIIKLSLYCKDNFTKELIKPFVDEFETEFHHTLSGLNWYDFMKLGTNKGTAIQILQKKLNITKDETVSFGDSFNDIEMFKESKYSFAMEDAHENVKKHANYTCSNVEETLKELYSKFFG